MSLCAKKNGHIDQIESCRQNIIQAAGNALELDKAINRLEKPLPAWQMNQRPGHMEKPTQLARWFMRIVAVT